MKPFDPLAEGAHRQQVLAAAEEAEQAPEDDRPGWQIAAERLALNKVPRTDFSGQRGAARAAALYGKNAIDRKNGR